MSEPEPDALTLEHVFGVSPGPAAVSLAPPGGGPPRAAYAVAHTVVLLGAPARRQAFLQGHRGAVSCLVAPPDRSVLISADEGADSLVVGWDPDAGQPLWTLAAPHAGGTVAMAVSADGRLLATLGGGGGGGGGGDGAAAAAVQELAVWQLPDPGPLKQRRRSGDSFDGETDVEPQAPAPALLATAAVPGGEPQRCVSFNPEDPSELVTNGARRVYFWRLPAAAAASDAGADGGDGSSGRQLSYYSPPLVAADFRQPVGAFLASVFIPGGRQVATSTADGDLVVWDEQGLSAAVGTRATDRRAAKIIRLHEKAIPFLGTVGGFVVTGGADGLVRFYDGRLRLVAWFEELAAGPIASVSFSTAGVANPEATTRLNRFVCPDFVVSTTHGKLVAVSSAAFDAPDNPGAAALLAGGPLAASAAPSSLGGGGAASLAGWGLVETACRDVIDIAAHPARPEAYVLGASGALQRWDLSSRVVVAARRLPAECKGARTLVVARDGAFVAVGFEGGHVVVVEPEGLADVAVARNSGQPIERLAASSSGRLLAASDAGASVLLMALLPYKATGHLRWEFVGRLKAHSAPVAALAFGESPAGETRLFSLGADGRAVEFDLRAPAAGGGLRALAVHAVAAPGAGAPAALCFAPPMPYWVRLSTETLLLVADEHYKVRAYNPDSRTYRATFLGPTYGGPVTRLLPFRSVSSGNSWLAYATADRVVGLAAWPLVGDPGLSMGVIAHPGRVGGLAVTHDGRKLLTVGAGGVINVWAIDTSSLEAHATALAAAAARASAAAPDDAPPPANAPPAAGRALAGADVAATGTDTARWEALAGDAATVEGLRDLFCYAELREAEARRAAGGAALGGCADEGGGDGGWRLTGRVPASALPDLMRAVGFYPSRAEEAALAAHVRFLAGLQPDDDTPPHVPSAATAGGPPAAAQQASAAGDGGRAAAGGQPGDESVDFGTFLSLFVNHRPLTAPGPADVGAAFEALGGGGALERGALVDALARGGDRMGEEELRRALEVLTGTGDPADALPSLVTPASLAADVLGFEL